MSLNGQKRPLSLAADLPIRAGIIGRLKIARKGGFVNVLRTALTSAVDIGQDAVISLTHMGMLSTDDLHAIGTIVDEKIKANNEIQTAAITETILLVVKDGFDGVDARFDEMATKVELNEMRHELMDHTDRVVQKSVGELRAELREANVLAS